MTTKPLLSLIMILAIILPISPRTGFACTSGCTTGAATIDGRPVLWGIIDRSDWWDEICLEFHTFGAYKVIAGSRGSTYHWQLFALNANGLARSVNSLSASTSSDNYYSLVNHRVDIADVRSAISTTKYDRHWYPFIDKHANAVGFELTDNDAFEYDVNSSLRANDPDYNYSSPYLFTVRANGKFSNTNHQEPESTWQTWNANNQLRYTTARDLMTNAIDDNKIDAYDLINIIRTGEPGDNNLISRYSPGGVCTGGAGIILGVKSGEQPKYATMLYAIGQPDYSIFIPAWTSLNELSAFVDGITQNDIGYWANRLVADADANDNDLYINMLFDGIQRNIIEGVKEARDRWFGVVGPNGSDFDNTIKYMHLWSSNAAFHSIRSAYNSRGSGRSCNEPPELSSFSVTSPSSGEIRITFDPTEGLKKYIVHWGNGTTSDWIDVGGSSAIQARSETGIADGTYQVAVLFEDNDTHKSRNVVFKWVTVGADYIPPSPPTGLSVVAP